LRRAALILALFLAPLAAAAEVVVAGLSQNEVSITANFNGSEILIFGAVRREAPLPEGAPLQVIIAVTGPDRRVTVRRKDRRFGIWINTEAIEIDEAPTFYAVATSAPLREVLSDTEDLRHRLSIPRAIRAVGTGDADQRSFVDALIRIRQNNGLYQLNEGAVNLREETLFDTAIRLPANLVEGDYQARFVLTRDGRVVDSLSTQITVRKVGLERLIYGLAHERPLIYGLLSLAIAIAAGWMASAVFRYIRS